MPLTFPPGKGYLPTLPFGWVECQVLPGLCFNQQCVLKAKATCAYTVCLAS